MKPAFKSVSQIDFKSFRVVCQDNRKEFDFPWHYHPEYELTFISNSQGVRYVGNHIENFYENDLVFLGPNLPHCWINTNNELETTGAVVIYLNKDLIQWLSNEQFTAISLLFEKSNRGVKFNYSVALRIKSKLIKLLNADSFEKYIIILQILNELSSTDEYQLLSQDGFSYELDITDNERVNVVYKYVRKNYHKKISLAEVASEVNMSRESFSRFFSKSLMKPFFTFLNEYRVNRACKLLIETDKQVSEICYNCGFESIPFFYRQFKKNKKFPPHTYRLKYKHATY